MRVETQPVQMLRLLSEGAFSNLFECSIHPRAVILLAGLVAFIFGLPRPEMPDRIKQRAVDRFMVRKIDDRDFAATDKRLTALVGHRYGEMSFSA